MIVMILERVKPSLRGELTRWLLEPRAGVFVGRVSAEVRDRLWDKVRDKRGDSGAGLLIHNSNTEQGFRIRSFGDTTRTVVELEGLQLIRRPRPAARK
jgi:CRISPR-associated protein Cas2